MSVTRAPMDPVPSQPLSDEEYERLADFLDEFGALDINELNGLFNAVAVAPSVMPPSTWLPVVLPDGPPATFDVDENRALVDLLLRQYNEVVTAFDTDTVIAPGPEQEDDCVQFAIGFVAGAELDPAWIDDELCRSFVAPFAYLCDRHDLIPPEELEELAADPSIKSELCTRLGELVAGAYDFFRDTGAVSPAQAPIRREGPRIGRNDPCPCGSGRKFKRCCGANQ
jgi:uncharacterized protein